MKRIYALLLALCLLLVLCACGAKETAAKEDIPERSAPEQKPETPAEDGLPAEPGTEAPGEEAPAGNPDFDGDPRQITVDGCDCRIGMTAAEFTTAVSVLGISEDAISPGNIFPGPDSIKISGDLYFCYEGGSELRARFSVTAPPDFDTDDSDACRQLLIEEGILDGLRITVFDAEAEFLYCGLTLQSTRADVSAFLDAVCGSVDTDGSASAGTTEDGLRILFGFTDSSGSTEGITEGTLRSVSVELD